MKPMIKDIREVTDSKEMYEKKPHVFISVFIYLIFIGLIAMGIWVYFGEIDIVAKGMGIVRPNERVSRIRNKVQGEIVENYLQEGKFVEKGEILFAIDDKALILKRTQMEKLLMESEEKLKLLKKLRESIEKNTNLFKREYEKEYYDRFIKYQQDYESLKNTAVIEGKKDKIASSQTEINRKIYDGKIEYYAAQIEELEEYRLSIEKEENIFEDKQGVLSLDFNTYLYQVHEIRDEIAEKQFAYELNLLLDKEGMISRKELEDSRIALEYAENKLSKIKMEQMKSIEEQQEKLRIEKEVAELEYNKLMVDETLQDAKDTQRKLEIEKFKVDNLVNLHSQIEEQEIICNTKREELKIIELAIEECKIVAPISGTLHILQEFNKGDLVEASAEIGTIIPQNDSMYKVEIFMPNHEINEIKKGDIIKYKFDALPYKEYGQLAGKIRNISVDASISSQQQRNGYVVEGSVENKTLYSYKNKPAQIKIGMTCEAYVVTEQKKILYYILEKINLMD